MIGSIIIQLRTYSIGFRVDDWIWKNMPGLREQQEVEIRTQLAENERALKPETRQKFPKPLVDANTSMNALYATLWGERLHETRFVIPFVAMGDRGKAAELRAVLDELPGEPKNDRIMIERWASAARNQAPSISNLTRPTDAGHAPRHSVPARRLRPQPTARRST
jgi:hypothetical protein